MTIRTSKRSTYVCSKFAYMTNKKPKCMPPTQLGLKILRFEIAFCVVVVVVVVVVFKIVFSWKFFN